MFQRARDRSGLTLEQLWLRHLEIGGLADLFEVDAFLHGLVPLDDLQQDMLAHVLNEALEDAYRAARVPYVRPAPPPPADPDPLAVVHELLAKLPEEHGSARDPEDPPPSG